MNLEAFPSAQIKLDQFFLEWLVAEGEIVLENVLEEFNSISLEDNQKSLGGSFTHNVYESKGISQSVGVNVALSRSPKKRLQSEMSYHEGAEPVSAFTLTSMLSEDLDPETPRDEERPAAEASSSRRRSNFDMIPVFYQRGPTGRNLLGYRVPEDALTRRLPEIESYFSAYPNGIPAEKFVHITKKLCGLPSFFNLPFCRMIHEQYGDKNGSGTGPPSASKQGVPRLSSRNNSGIIIPLHTFLAFWQAEIEPFTRVERFFRVIKQKDVNYICKDDFVPYLKELLFFHPGLEFLASHEEFKRKYALTVITRIFYKVNVSRTGKITLRELKASNLFTEFIHVDEEIDINKVTEYFSYEHFYVLYCRFFELDNDKDGKLGIEDIARYGDYCLSEPIVERIFQVGVRAFSDGLEEGFSRSPRQGLSGSMSLSGSTPGSTARSGQGSTQGMTIPDFIYFMLAEEDKTSPSSIKFWFNCCDMDCDGKLSFLDMWHFYRAQTERILAMGQDGAHFEDVLCQMVDYLNPEDPNAITLDDLLKPEKKQCAALLFDVLFNLHKLMRFEMRDPFQEKLRREDGFTSEWNRFAYYEYIKLASEEEGGDGNDAVDSDGGIGGAAGTATFGMDVDHEAAAKEFGNQYFLQQQQQQQLQQQGQQMVQQPLRSGPETTDADAHEPRPATTGLYGSKAASNGSSAIIFHGQHRDSDGRGDESKASAESKHFDSFK